MADRFHAPDPPVGDVLTLGGDEAHHLARVRRVGLGEFVVVFDGRGSTWNAEVLETSRDQVRLRIVETLPPSSPPACELTLATAMPKGDRADWLVEKATELGVARLQPLNTARSIVDPRSAKLEKLRRRVVEASKQCGRDWLMEIVEPIRWAELLAATSTPLRLVAHPGGLPALRWPRCDRDRAVTLAIGPEGGFTDEEVAQAQAAGWRVVGMGTTLLRVETAGLAVSALVLALADNRDE